MPQRKNRVTWPNPDESDDDKLAYVDSEQTVADMVIQEKVESTRYTIQEFVEDLNVDVDRMKQIRDEYEKGNADVDESISDDYRREPVEQANGTDHNTAEDDEGKLRRRRGKIR